jgi:hypothetical protein
MDTRKSWVMTAFWAERIDPGLVGRVVGLDGLGTVVELVVVELVVVELVVVELVVVGPGTVVELVVVGAGTVVELVVVELVEVAAVVVAPAPGAKAATLHVTAVAIIAHRPFFPTTVQQNGRSGGRVGVALAKRPVQEAGGDFSLARKCAVPSPASRGSR